MTVLNGCDIRRFDKSSRKCRKCTNNSYCARKMAEPISYDRPMRDEVTKLQRVLKISAAESVGECEILAEAMRKVHGECVEGSHER